MSAGVWMSLVVVVCHNKCYINVSPNDNNLSMMIASLLVVVLIVVVMNYDREWQCLVEIYQTELKASKWAIIGCAEAYIAFTKLYVH